MNASVDSTRSATTIVCCGGGQTLGKRDGTWRGVAARKTLIVVVQLALPQPVVLWPSPAAAASCVEDEVAPIESNTATAANEISPVDALEGLVDSMPGAGNNPSADAAANTDPELAGAEANELAESPSGYPDSNNGTTGDGGEAWGSVAGTDGSGADRDTRAIDAATNPSVSVPFYIDMRNVPGGRGFLSSNYLRHVLDPIDITRDTLGRITTVAVSGAGAMNYSYASGRSDNLLASMSSQGTSSAWTYDAQGRVLSKRQTVGTVARTLNVIRDSLGRVSTMTYPSGMQVAVSYRGDVVSALAVNGVSLLNNIAYRPFSQPPTGWSWGNGSTYARSFDPDGRITSVNLGNVQRSYRYDAAGRIDQQTDVSSAGTQVASIGYDEAGQLTSYSGSAGSYTYAYDTNGNRRTMVEDGVSSSNTYAAGSNRILSSPTANYIYNADGSPSNNGSRTLGYNIYGRMTTMNMPSETITRTYDAMGLRVRSVTQVYVSGGPLNRAAGAGTAAPSPAPSSAKTPSPTPAAAGSWMTDSLREFFHDDSGRLLGEYDSCVSEHASPSV